VTLPHAFIIEANQANFWSGAWEHTTWRQTPVYKYPEDLLVYAEIIHDPAVWPTVIVETGTALGGSAVFFADMLDILPGPARRVITIDVEDHVTTKDWSRIHYVKGSSVDIETVEMVEDLIKPDDVVMVCLDSDHLEDHVWAELQLWPRLVTPGSYLVVEDTFISRYGCRGVRFASGSSWEALCRWLPDHPDFQPDSSREKFMLSMNPGGWLRRTA
jgi:cephalosporin hydroxylase